MSTLSKLHENAAKHHEDAARHHREAVRLHEVKDIVAEVDQAHMATDHQAHAIHYATQAAKEYLAAHRGS
jgi:DNA-directed RNA polymerase subunit F